MPLPAIGAAVAAGLGFIGQERANKQNRREAEVNRDFQSVEAEKNRQFQERMRNTAWQSAVEDARAAGINPMALTGGAAVPGGSMAGGSQAASQQNSASSAMDMVRARSELEALKASIEKTRNESRAAGSIADREEARNRAYGFVRGRDGSIRFDYSMPGLLKETEAIIAERIANASRAQSMATISGLGGQVASGFQNFIPAFQKLTEVSGQGADQLAGVVGLLERVARMRDDAVRTYLGVPRAFAVRMLESLRKRGN